MTIKANDYKKHFKTDAKAMTTDELKAAVAKERESMTPEQWEAQRQAAIDIMGPSEFFDGLASDKDTMTDVVKGDKDSDKEVDKPKSKLVVKPKKGTGDAEEK